jgi:hypothetical protein
MKKKTIKLTSVSMLDQKIGSSLDIKTNEDFNNEHPDHDASGRLRANSNPEGDIKGNGCKQRSDINTTETKSNNKAGLKIYTCSMHPEVISDKAGKCPKCKMDLIEKNK